MISKLTKRINNIFPTLHCRCNLNSIKRNFIEHYNENCSDCHFLTEANLYTFHAYNLFRSLNL